MERRELGLRMHQWHLGQGDPIYAVGSYLFVDKPYPDYSLMEAALMNLERIRVTVLRRSDEKKEEVMTEIEETIEALKEEMTGDEYKAAKEESERIREEIENHG